MSKQKHAEVKAYIAARSLVSALMLVVDYIVPPNENDAFVFNAWASIVNRWENEARIVAMRWANLMRRYQMGEVSYPGKPSELVTLLPFTTFRECAGVVADESRLGTAERTYCETYVIDAVERLPVLVKTHLRTAWEMLQGQGPEFDDARTELLAMAFEFAHVPGKWGLGDLTQFAKRALDEKLAPMLTATEKEIADECGALLGMLIEKNRKYGDSALNPVHVFSKEPAHVQLRQQLDHKLARIKRGDASVEDEDVVRDLLGYLVLYRIAFRRARQAGELVS